MAYYCGECVTWVNSKDGDRYGRKYCDYSGRYEESTQNIYGCRGFVWARRSILTKICEILGIDNSKLFNAFDEVKEEYLVSNKMNSFIDYNTIGPEIAISFDTLTDDTKKRLAINMLNGYIIPAESYVKMKKYDEAFSIYERMVKVLMGFFMVTKDSIEEKKFYNNLIRVKC